MSFATTAIRSACTAQTVVASPLGPMLLARTPAGLAGAWFLRQKDHPGELAAPDKPRDPLLRRAAEQLQRYFGGAKDGFDLPLDLLGTAFQRAVWNALLGIPLGSTRSYGQIAHSIDAPQAVRAVGAAIGKNPLGIVVPCHRVIGSSGALTGYAAGLERKTALLELEGAHFTHFAHVTKATQPRLFEDAA